MNASVTLAMRVYSSWTERVFSQDGFESLLMLCMFVVAILVPLSARRHTSKSAYLSGGFILALCPFLFAAVIALLRIHSLIDHEDLTPSYVVERLRFPRQVLISGGCLSAFSLIIYSVIHAARRRPKPMSSEHLISNERSA